MKIYVINVDSDKQAWESWIKHADEIGIPANMIHRYSAIIDDRNIPDTIDGVADIFTNYGYYRVGAYLKKSIENRMKYETWNHGLSDNHFIRSFASELSRLTLYKSVLETHEPAFVLSDTSYFTVEFDVVTDVINRLGQHIDGLFFEYYGKYTRKNEYENDVVDADKADKHTYLANYSHLKTILDVPEVWGNAALPAKCGYFTPKGMSRFYDYWTNIAHGAFCRSVLPVVYQKVRNIILDDFYLFKKPVVKKVYNERYFKGR